ncbi:RAD51-associated protein 1 isoform X2 [Onychomys torridus]|uniref:RAD51-associated protein 1 isoform X2 n=1 Tax=Onychomys torridus TaxID=38674 RepID=UPI00167F52BC|nr:RAD51-associated protein 1 isoform X2 [Onychomys torridus]
MVRPTRNKKPVNYSQFEDSGGDSDDDFISSTMPRNKKPKTVPKELKQDNPKPSLKTLQKEDILPANAPKKRMALDDKVFQRGLEVALALSVKELPTVTNQKSQEKSTDEHSNRKAEITEKSPAVSNCSGTSDNSDLDKVGEEGDASSGEGEKKTTSKARSQRQRRALSEGSDGSDVDDAELDSTADEDSESESHFDESEESDDEFAVRKRKVKGTKKKAVQRRPAVGKERKSEHECEASVTSVDMAPAAIKSGSPSFPEAVGLSSETTRKPAKMCSPSAEGKRPKWVPPAASGSRSSSSSPLAGAPTKSPSQSLRLGLSRLAPVKRLHPNATSSQVQ